MDPHPPLMWQWFTEWANEASLPLTGGSCAKSPENIVFYPPNGIS